MVKIWSEWNENCWNYAACRFKKTCSDKNAFKVLRCVSEQSGVLKKELGITGIQIFSSYSRRFKASFKTIKKNRFSENYSGLTP